MDGVVVPAVFQLFGRGLGGSPSGARRSRIAMRPVDGMGIRRPKGAEVPPGAVLVPPREKRLQGSPSWDPAGWADNSAAGTGWRPCRRRGRSRWGYSREGDSGRQSLSQRAFRAYRCGARSSRLPSRRFDFCALAQDHQVLVVDVHSTPCAAGDLAEDVRFGQIPDGVVDGRFRDT